MMKGPANVTAMGIVCSTGSNIDEFTRALREGRSGVGTLTIDSGPAINPGVAALIEDFSPALFETYRFLGEEFFRALQIAVMRAPRCIQFSTLSALEAWCQAGLHKDRPDPHQISLIVGGSNLSQSYTYHLQQKFETQPAYLNPRYPLHFMDTDHVGTISEVLGIHGEGFTVGGASASGSVALVKGLQTIRHGEADVCLVIGAMADLSPMELQGFHNIGAMGGRRFKDNPAGACRPFDKDHEGFIYGQGCGCMVLESEASMRRRGVEPLATLAGGIVSLDGNRLSDPGEEGEARAMTLAIEQADVKTADIGYINTHGTSSPLGDRTEIAAIKRVFDGHLDNVWVNSTKSMTGHCLTAAGMVESIATVIQLRNHFIHPNLNLDSPIENRIKFAGPISTNATFDIALKNSFGFGGINCSLVFSNPKLEIE
jgi:malonyl-ACP decarboxylase